MRQSGILTLFQTKILTGNACQGIYVMKQRVKNGFSSPIRKQSRLGFHLEANMSIRLGLGI